MKSKKILPLLFLAFLDNPLNASQFQTTVENIINEFAQNSIVAEDQYMNKRIKLTKGEILSIDDSVFSEFVGQNELVDNLKRYMCTTSFLHLLPLHHTFVASSILSSILRLNSLNLLLLYPLAQSQSEQHAAAVRGAHRVVRIVASCKLADLHIY